MVRLGLFVFIDQEDDTTSYLSNSITFLWDGGRGHFTMCRLPYPV